LENIVTTKKKYLTTNVICPYFDKLSKVKQFLFLNGNKIKKFFFLKVLFSLVARPLPPPPPPLYGLTISGGTFF
jgi:hypothetical protein